MTIETYTVDADNQLVQLAYHAWHRADVEWNAELVHQFGSRAADMRYLPEGRGTPGSRLRALCKCFEAGRMFYEAILRASEKGDNLSQDGNAWVFDYASVSGDAWAFDFSGGARVSSTLLALSAIGAKYGIMRSDGRCFVCVDCKDKQKRVIGGSRYFTWEEAVAHWDKKHPHYTETKAILDFFRATGQI